MNQLPVIRTQTAPAADTGATRRSAAPSALADAAPARTTAGRAGGARAPLGRGLNSWDHQLNGAVASAQQALDYLDQLANALQTAKGELAARLSGRGAQLDAHVEQLGKTWRARRQASGASLNPQLDYSHPAPANQRFRIPGLELDALQAGPAQTLSFAPGAGGQYSINIGPDMTREQIVQAFDRTLAPAGMRVTADAGGALVFSTPEANWPALRESLALGAGSPGQPNAAPRRVALVEEPPLLTPERMRAADTEGVRRSLQDVVRALAQVTRAQGHARAALSEAAGHAAVASAPDVGAMQGLAQDFAAQAADPSYSSLLTLSSALVGISRERVLALLGLR